MSATARKRLALSAKKRGQRQRKLEETGSVERAQETTLVRGRCVTTGAVSEKMGQDPAVMRFITIAKGFCGLLESKHRSKRRFVEQVLKAR